MEYSNKDAKTMERVKEQIQKKGLSYRDVSEIAGVSISSVYSYFRTDKETRMRIPSDVVHTLAKKWGVSYDYLTGDSDYQYIEDEVQAESDEKTKALCEENGINPDEYRHDKKLIDYINDLGGKVNPYPEYLGTINDGFDSKHPAISEGGGIPFFKEIQEKIDDYIKELFNNEYGKWLGEVKATKDIYTERIKRPMNSTIDVLFDDYIENKKPRDSKKRLNNDDRIIESVGKKAFMTCESYFTGEQLDAEKEAYRAGYKAALNIR